LFFIETIIYVVSFPFVFSSYGIIQPQITPKVAAPKVSKGRSQTSPVFIALWSPPQRRNPCMISTNLCENQVPEKIRKKIIFFEKQAGKSQNTSNINIVRVFDADPMREWRNWQTR
jgi:hypothetical protein